MRMCFFTLAVATLVAGCTVTLGELERFDLDADEAMLCGVYYRNWGRADDLWAELERRGLVDGENRETVDAGRVSLGMTECEAQIAWGHLYEINRTITGRRHIEQWVFGDGNYLYFENGRINAIQN